MFDDVLIESAGKDKKKGSWVTALISAVVHIGIIGGIIAAGYYVKQNPQVVEKPIHAFISSAPPPPPPPPPAAAASHAATPHVTTQPREVPQFHQPRQVPTEVPQENSDTTGAQEGGVVGGQVGGVAGGVVGGVVGGVLGGQLGGQIGGQIGGTGDKPLRVGGNVMPPVAIRRVEPQYTEIARKTRREGMVIIEAIIDTNGNVTDARVLKGLGFGLDEAALDALKRTKFSPGTLNGQPVPVVYDLTVNFRLQ